MKTTENIGLWYNRTFFRKYLLGEDKDRKSQIENEYPRYLNIKANKTGPNYLKVEFSKEPASNTISLTTIYPGLVCGIGYEHEIGNKKDNEIGNKKDNEIGLKNELKLGFSFDYTTGMPYIPGSSVKGLLRSAFDHKEYMDDIFSNISSENKPKISDWDKVKKSIFEGYDSSTEKQQSVYKRDLFFDAFISGSDADNENLILADDYITCHQNKNEEMTPFTEPNPVRFLKVRSGVTFTFKFLLTDSPINENTTLKAEHKILLFKQILLDLGIGAKTNVGYGQFSEPEN